MCHVVKSIPEASASQVVKVAGARGFLMAMGINWVLTA